MNVWEIVKAAGVPAMALAIIIGTWVKIRAISRGVQALLRDRLVEGYKHFREIGYADEDDRDNLENVYVQYHNLGANGVMDDLRSKFLALPVERRK